MKVIRDDLSGPEVIALVKEHLEQMARDSPPGSCHALGVEDLRKNDVTFWSVWEEEQLLGCGALKELGASHGEIKSMRTVAKYRGQGVAAAMLEHILNEAKKRNYSRVSLETGSNEFYLPARKLYLKYGFEVCAPFGDYKDDPNSTFMTKEL